MNANDLADELEKSPTLWFKDDIAGKWIIEKLRQQQAEIERLIGAEPITYGMLTFCKNCGQQNPYFEKAQKK
jgi:hypothetical protein